MITEMINCYCVNSSVGASFIYLSKKYPKTNFRRHISKDSTYIAIIVLDEASITDLFILINDKEGVDEAFAEIIRKWQVFEEEFSRVKFSCQKQKTDNFIKYQKLMADDIADSEFDLEKIKSGSKALDLTAKSVCVAISATLSYFTAVKRISRTQQENVDSVKKYKIVTCKRVAATI